MMRFSTPERPASSATSSELVTMDIDAMSRSARTTHTPDVESSSMIELPEGTIAAAQAPICSLAASL